jgi:hypothetical protein
MATVKNEETKKEETQQQTTNLELVVLETRKVKAMEKIANSLDALTIWFEEIDKKDWSERIAYYLYEFHNLAKMRTPNEDSTTTSTTDSNPIAQPVRKVRPKKDIETV